MKVKTLSLLAGAGAMMIAGAASADFTGLSVDLHNVWTDAGTGNTYDVYRVYANFSGLPNSGVGFWGGSPDDDFTYNVTSLGSDGVSPGSGFFQTGFAGSALVQSAGALYSAFAEEFDNSTYMTIGVAAGYTPYDEGTGEGDVGEVFLLSPGHNPNVTNSWGGTGGVVADPGSPNSLADANNQVLLMQLAVAQGEHAEGNIAVSWFADGENNLTVGTSFSTMVIPAPGALALIGLAGLVGTRRRRA